MFNDEFLKLGAVVFLLVPHMLDEGSLGCVPQHRHLPRVDSVCPQLAGVVYADYCVQLHTYKHKLVYLMLVLNDTSCISLCAYHKC